MALRCWWMQASLKPLQLDSQMANMKGERPCQVASCCRCSRPWSYWAIFKHRFREGKIPKKVGVKVKVSFWIFACFFVWCWYVVSFGVGSCWFLKMPKGRFCSCVFPGERWREWGWKGGDLNVRLWYGWGKRPWWGSFFWGQNLRICFIIC